MGFPGGSSGKESACKAGELASILGSGRSPGEGNVNTFQYSYLGKFHGQRHLVGYSPWGSKESDTTEQLTQCSLYRAKQLLETELSSDLPDLLLSPFMSS